MFVTLRCRHCDKVDCPSARPYIPDDSLEGCTRQVSDLDAEKFQYYIEEVIPMHPPMTRLLDAEQFLQQIYQAPLGRKLDVKGKAVS